MVYQPDEFKPTPREEEILSRCVDYNQFREEVDALSKRLEVLEKENNRRRLNE